MFKWIKAKTYSTKYDLEVEKIPPPKNGPIVGENPTMIQVWGPQSPIKLFLGPLSIWSGSLGYVRSGSSGPTFRSLNPGPNQLNEPLEEYRLVFRPDNFGLNNVPFFLEMTYFGRDILKLFTSVWRCLFNKNELARVYTPYFVNWFSRLIP